MQDKAIFNKKKCEYCCGGHYKCTECDRICTKSYEYSYEYLNGGKAIAQGKGYVQIWNPDAPPHWRSVGYPFLLSLLIRLSDNLIYLKCFSLVCYMANILLIYYLFLCKSVLSRHIHLALHDFLAIEVKCSYNYPVKQTCSDQYV